MGRGYIRTSGFYGKFNRNPRRTGELKFFDLNPVNAVITAVGEIIDSSINNIAQGTLENQRIGRKCTIKSIQWQYDIELPQGVATTRTDVVRVIVYLDRQCNGATIAVTDLLETDNYQSFRNLANTSRFAILYDKTINMNVNASFAAEHIATTKTMRWYKRCNIPLEFDNTTGGLSEIRSMNVGIMTLSKNGFCELGTSVMRLRFSG